MNEKFLSLKDELQNQFVEREDVIDGMLLGMLTGQHVLLLGPPGTAKSLLAREICARIAGATYFERLLTKFTVPEELFGPISLSALEHDNYKRITTNKLPEAHIAFLDEIFKANSAILNTLLTLLNERLYHNDGVIQNVPLIFMVGASNELPEEETLAALYDRFLLRFVVNYVSDEMHFRSLLHSTTNRNIMFTHDELSEARAETKNIKISDTTIEGLIKLRCVLTQELNFSISDRRWKESLKLAQGSAFLSGRSETNLTDLHVLQHALWDKIEDAPKIIMTLNQTLYPERSKMMGIYDAAIDAFKSFQQAESSKKALVGTEATKKIKESVKELEVIHLSPSDHSTRTTLVNKLKSYLEKIVQERLA